MNKESAFPIAYDDRAGAYQAEPGMTTRTYIATRMMAQHVATILADGFVPGRNSSILQDYADSAVACADALIAALATGD